jgi:hypothetical protein
MQGLALHVVERKNLVRNTDASPSCYHSLVSYNFEWVLVQVKVSRGQSSNRQSITFDPITCVVHGSRVSGPAGFPSKVHHYHAGQWNVGLFLIPLHWHSGSNSPILMYFIWSCFLSFLVVTMLDNRELFSPVVYGIMTSLGYVHTNLD